MYKSALKNRIAVLVICVLMVLGSIPPVLTCEQVFAASESADRIVTIYTSDGTSASSYDFATASGLDTLVTPAYATGYNITWKSSNTDIAEVDGNGHVLGMLTGKYASKSSATCKITATLTWNGQTTSDTIKVKVIRGTDITGTFFTNGLTNIKFVPGESMHILSDQDSGDSSQTESDTRACETENENDIKRKIEISESLQHDHVEGQMLVVFDDDAKKSDIKKTLGDHDADLEQITKIDGEEKAALATVDSEEGLQAAMESLADNDNVAYVQPNYIYTLDDFTPSEYQEDPYYDSDKGYQYFHKLMNTRGAWDLLDSNGISQTTIVGVVDSGVDTDHIDLKDNLILTDGKYKRFSGNTAIMSEDDNISSGHGTHVSGIIGAVYGNGKGGAGVATGAENSYCKILPTGVVESSGSLNSNSVINGINYVINNGAKVVNMSFGSDAKDRAVGRTITSNYYNKKVVFVSSAGNKDKDELDISEENGTERLECPNFPSDMKEVISVCNIDSSGNKHKSSYTGLAKDISAPGVTIYSTIPYDQSLEKPYTYGAMSGTSMSAPMVSGVAALILDANPDLTPQEVRNIICATAYDSSDYYKSREMGYGRIDAKACVEAAYAAREHAQSGTTDSVKPELTIKTFYAGEPDPFVVDDYVTTSKSKSISKIPSFSASAAKRKIKLTFGKASVVTTTTTKTTQMYYTGLTGTITEKKKTYSTSGVKYQIRVKKGSTTKYYKVSANKKTVTAAISIAPGADSIRVNVKKFGNTRLKSGSVCYVSVRAYKAINGNVKYGKWTSTKKVKVK